MSQTAQIELFQMRDFLTVPYEVASLQVSSQIQKHLWEQKPLTINSVRRWMNHAFGGSDASGYWNWKDATEAQECAFVHLLKQNQKAFLAPSSDVMPLLAIIEKMGLTHSVRTQESIQLQQFSTPPQIGYLAALCAQITQNDWTLEPSAGTGILAGFAELFGSRLVLNEIDKRRLLLLKKLFPGLTVYSHNAEQIHDYLSDTIEPTLVLINPPFSASPNFDRRNPLALADHIRSALLRLTTGGRMVLIAASWFTPESPSWNRAFQDIQPLQIRLNALITGGAYYKHGVTLDTRLLVIDKVPSDAFSTLETELSFKRCLIHRNGETIKAKSFDADEIEKLSALPARGTIQFREKKASSLPRKPIHLKTCPTKAEFGDIPRIAQQDTQPIKYEVLKTPSLTVDMGDTLYETYAPKRIRIENAHPHPSLLCESIALSSISPHCPTYQPILPIGIVENGVLSEAQLEFLIYAGEAHSEYLKGHYRVENNWEKVILTTKDAHGAVQFRRGVFCGDSTGVGKGRELASIALDNFCRGRTKAIWISKSEKLIHDARRDWCALGGETNDIIPLSKFKQGDTITLKHGILFTTYATLRSPEKPDKKSRLEQIIDWLGIRFDGVILFDESHLLGNAAGRTGRGGNASLQGIAGLKLQNAVPNARIVYASATAASRVANLAYANRLGLWSSGDFPFPTRDDFIEKIESGGVASMEIVCRDLKALGLYFSRNLSFDGVDYEPLEIELTEAQIEIYNRYAYAFQIIHQNLERALELSNITNSQGKTLNKDAKRVAIGIFESLKQRFFEGLITSMKCPMLIREFEQDLENGYAIIVQLVSTNEELMERRLAEIPVEEWNDLHIDITPREYLMRYLARGFPTQLYEKYTSKDGELKSRLVKDTNGNSVICRELVEQRDRLIEQLGTLPPVNGALDQILHHFGEDIVAEVTGRSRRILCDKSSGRLYVASRSASSNITEVDAFQGDKKHILLFSDAGSTGASYHADLNCLNTRRRKHYLLQSGWKAENAIQGLGRSNRSNQLYAPIFRPVVTNVRGERRFLSTISRRMNALGALSRGQRQTGGQGLFNPRDDLESVYAQAALETFFSHLADGKVQCCTLALFESSTGLQLMTEQGRLKDELPKISTFLNRILALPINLQNSLFEYFELLIDSNVESAIATGRFDQGVETLTAEKLRVIKKETIYTHPNGAQTYCAQIEKLERTFVRTSEEAKAIIGGKLLVNQRSKRACVCVPAPTTINLDTGAVIDRVELIYAGNKTRIPISELENSCWHESSESLWKERWDNEANKIPEFSSNRLFLICGLLLPIWNYLDSDSVQVFRVQLETQEKLLGRIVEADKMTQLAETLGLQQIQLTGTEIYNLVFKEHKNITIAPNLQLRKVRVRGEHRLELGGSALSFEIGTELKTIGVFAEVIEWKTRYFIPTNEQGANIVEQIRKML
ncbi:strawberry notch-like NTP hydrolase domain-containing protein [Leptolyngbya sp. AN03gr2]|uniref:strawberry notch-like NTP hydrolase domain-containing protein n=1 Tax=unclassified Leptolyngbya TaxID=2650499 RepID=UPI003D31013B